MTDNLTAFEQKATLDTMIRQGVHPIPISHDDEYAILLVIDDPYQEVGAITHGGEIIVWSA